MNAGFTNGLGILGMSATLSHMTGVTTRIGTQLAAWDTAKVSIDLWTLLAYCSGVFISGLIVGPRGKLKLNIRYTVPFLIEAICLTIVASAPDFAFPAYSAKGLISFAMGIQNGVTCGWSGGVGRSTHITGFLADITMVMAYMFYSLTLADTWRLSMFIPFYFSFMFGAFLGGLTWYNLTISRHAFYVPAAFCYFIAAFIILREIFVYKKGYHIFEEDKPNNNNNKNPDGSVDLAVMPTAIVVVGADAPGNSVNTVNTVSDQAKANGELVEGDGLESISDFV